MSKDIAHGCGGDYELIIRDWEDQYLIHDKGGAFLVSRGPTYHGVYGVKPEHWLCGFRAAEPVSLWGLRSRELA